MIYFTTLFLPGKEIEQYYLNFMDLPLDCTAVSY